MVFLKFSAFYPDLLAQVYARNEGLSTAPYEQQMQALFDQGFAMSNFWKVNLEKTGQFTVHEIIGNAEQAQKTWAKEHGVSYKEESWKFDILDAQIDRYKPEAIFLQDYANTPSYYKKKFPFVKYVIIWDGLGHRDMVKFDGADMIATSHKNAYDFYKQKGIPTYYFLFGYETSFDSKLQHRAPKYDFSFVGSLNAGKGYHNDRIKLLYKLSKEVDVQCWLSGMVTPKFKTKVKRILLGEFAQTRQLRELSERNNGKVFGIEMLQVLADSKITFNSHIDIAENIAGNLRLFEATGVGTCLLTDWKVNLHEIFEIDKEVVAYKSMDECIEKAKWLLNNEAKRKEIAAAGQARTRKDYSMANRIFGLMKAAGLLKEPIHA